MRLPGGGGFRRGTILFFSLAPKYSPRNLFAHFGVFPCVSHLGAAAGYCCAAVGSPSVRHRRSPCALGSEKLVVVEIVCELWSGCKKGGMFLTVGGVEVSHV